MSEVDYATIPGPEAKCMVCGKDLVRVPKHPTVLELSEKGEPERHDVCKDCWDRMADREFFSFWLTHRDPPKPDMRRTRAQQRAALLRLFERFQASGDQRLRTHLYVLGHILMKLRLLVWEGAERDENGVQWVVFRNPATDVRVLVEEVRLDDESLVTVKREIDTAMAVDAIEGNAKKQDPS